MTAALTRHLEASRQPDGFTLFARSTLNDVFRR